MKFDGKRLNRNIEKAVPQRQHAAFDFCYTYMNTRHSGFWKTTIVRCFLPVIVKYIVIHTFSVGKIFESGKINLQFPLKIRFDETFL